MLGITMEDVFGSVKTERSRRTAGKDATSSALFESAGSNNNNGNRNQNQNRNNGQRQGQGKKQQGQGQTNQDSKWCHIDQSNLHDLKECCTASEMFGSKTNTTTYPAATVSSGTTVLSSVSSATDQAALASALIVKTASPFGNPITLTWVH
jgi:hypothetical protein